VSELIVEALGGTTHRKTPELHNGLWSECPRAKWQPWLSQGEGSLGDGCDLVILLSWGRGEGPMPRSDGCAGIPCCRAEVNRSRFPRWGSSFILAIVCSASSSASADDAHRGQKTQKTENVEGDETLCSAPLLRLPNSSGTPWRLPMTVLTWDSG
jgi:hypothetical protein